MTIGYSHFGAVLLISSSVLARAVEGTRSNSQCDNDTVDIYNDFNLEEASDAFFESFSTHCDAFADASKAESSICDFPNGNPTPKMDVFVSYVPLRNGELYQSVVNACEELEGHKACTVDTEQATDELSIKTIGQPLCMPQVCSSDTEDDVVALLDAQGATPFCTDDECTVKFQNVACPSDGTDTPALWTPETEKNGHKDSSSCKREAVKMDLDQLGEFTDFYDALFEVYDDIKSSCSAIGDDPISDKCRVEIEPFSMSMVADFDRMKSEDSYQAYRSACEEAGGSLCTISTRFDLAFAYEEAIDANLTVDLNNLPVCFAESCSSNEWGYDFLEDLVLDAIEDNTDFSRRLSHSSRHRRSLIESLSENKIVNDNKQERRKAKVEEDSWEDEDLMDGTPLRPWDKVNIGRDPSDEVQSPMNEVDTSKANRKTSEEEDSSSDEEFLALSDICDALESMDEGLTRCNFEFERPMCNEQEPGHVQQYQSQQQQGDTTSGSGSSRGGLIVSIMVLLSVGIVLVVGLITTKRSPTVNSSGGETNGDHEATTDGDGEFV